jgi:hypothetical protein
MANSFDTAEGLTAQSSPPSVQLQQNNQTQPFIQCNEANSSWTIWPCKNQQFSHIAKMKWCWRSTATPATSMKRRPEAKPVAITSYQRTYLSPQIRGCTGEFSRTKAKKKCWFHVRKKKRSQKNVTKNNRGHPQNRRFPLLTMVANIHLWALLHDVNITSSRH